MLRCIPSKYSEKFPVERCESGRIDVLGKHASRQRDRGFKSHPLRHCLARQVRSDYQPMGNGAPVVPTGNAVDCHNKVLPGATST